LFSAIKPESNQRPKKALVSEFFFFLPR